MKQTWLIIFAITILGACTENPGPAGSQLQNAPLYFPPIEGDGWETVSTTSLNWCPDKLNDLKSYLGSKNTKAFIILKDGKIAVEWYYDTFSKDSLWYWASAGKSLTAFLIGIAQQEGALSIQDKTSKYLGTGWTSAPANKEDLITIKNQLTMTTGLNDGVEDKNCTDKECLQYLTDAGERWAYHNAPYTLLGEVLERATGVSRNEYTRTRLRTRIGMVGTWRDIEFNDVFFSKPRSMARFGLLMLNKGVWDEDVILQDKQYFEQMISSSQDLNPSYGYLWWLNGKERHKLPTTQEDFLTDLIPNAPNDMYAALGRGDQKLYVVPSKQLVVIRMGESAGQSRLALSSFDNELWGKINNLPCE